MELNKLPEWCQVEHYGDLTIGIYCTKCNAQFELGKVGVALACMMNASFLEYLNFVQNRKCPKCDGKGSQP